MSCGKWLGCVQILAPQDCPWPMLNHTAELTQDIYTQKQRAARGRQGREGQGPICIQKLSGHREGNCRILEGDAGELGVFAFQ